MVVCAARTVSTRVRRSTRLRSRTSLRSTEQNRYIGTPPFYSCVCPSSRIGSCPPCVLCLQQNHPGTSGPWRVIHSSTHSSTPSIILSRSVLVERMCVCVCLSVCPVCLGAGHSTEYLLRPPCCPAWPRDKQNKLLEAAVLLVLPPVCCGCVAESSLSVILQKLSFDFLHGRAPQQARPAPFCCHSASQSAYLPVSLLSLLRQGLPGVQCLDCFSLTFPLSLSPSTLGPHSRILGGCSWSEVVDASSDSPRHEISHLDGTCR